MKRAYTDLDEITGEIVRHTVFECAHVFAHGKLQENLMDDRLSSDTDLASLPDGIHNFDSKGWPCIAYLWSNGQVRRGLVAYASDAKAMRFARSRFESRASTI